MFLFLIGAVILIFIKDVHSQQISNTRLVDAEAYFTRVVQEVVYEIEDNDWCNFRVPEIHQSINLPFYAWESQIEVYYRNGFIVSLDSVAIRQDTVVHMLTNELAQVRGNVYMHNVVTGYDVTATTSDGQQHFTALYRHMHVEFRFMITKQHSTNEITTQVTQTAHSAVTTDGHIKFLPTNNITEVMSRLFFAYTPDMSGWATFNIAPVLDEVAKTRVEFPRICYNCAS